LSVSPDHSPDDSSDDAPDGPDPGRPGPPGRPQAGDAGPRAYLDQPVGEFLSELSAGHAAPGGGSAAALAVALGASLCAMAARLSAQQLSGPDIEFLVAEAERLRGSAASLVQADAESYRGVVAALRDQRGQDPGAAGHLTGPDAGHQRARIDAALSEAATIPMEVLELAAPTARLAARLAAHGNPRLRGDAITAALLAEAGARAAAVLVSINLAMLPGDDRPARAEALLSEVTRAVQAAADR
jgi:formiminotetrahydrofolate cyclodeaminase